ncbi:hypothetical protein ONZ45_g10355 [Pleurotus djamor]|nr:hypothetical protein ONZ45_g10355 [Pleurotus djamor]
MKKSKYTPRPKQEQEESQPAKRTVERKGYKVKERNVSRDDMYEDQEPWVRKERSKEISRRPWEVVPTTEKEGREGQKRGDPATSENTRWVTKTNVNREDAKKRMTTKEREVHRLTGKWLRLEKDIKMINEDARCEYSWFEQATLTDSMKAEIREIRKQLDQLDG